jgi:hypothetical protein
MQLFFNFFFFFFYSSTCFGRFPARRQELIDFSGSLWFYLRIVVTVVIYWWSGRPAGLPDMKLDFMSVFCYNKRCIFRVKMQSLSNLDPSKFRIIFS